MLTILLIASCVALSWGQTNECVTIYNDTLGDDPTDNGACGQSFFSLFIGFARQGSDEATVVCNEGQDCNTRLRNIFDVCGDSVSLNDLLLIASRSSVLHSTLQSCVAIRHRLHV